MLSTILNEKLVNDIERLVNYVLPNEETHFLEESNGDAAPGHIYLTALELKCALGNNKVEKDVAEVLVSTPGYERRIYCAESPKNPVVTEYLINGSFPSDWKNFMLKDKN